MNLNYNPWKIKFSSSSSSSLSLSLSLSLARSLSRSLSLSAGSGMTYSTMTYGFLGHNISNNGTMFCSTIPPFHKENNGRYITVKGQTVLI